jgi:hypothetical protein
MYIITLDSTNKCLVIDRSTSGQTFEQEKIEYAQISDVDPTELSTNSTDQYNNLTTLAANFAAGNFNLANRVTIEHGDGGYKYKTKRLVLDLLNEDYAWSTAPTVRLNSAASVAGLIQAAYVGNSVSTVSGTFTSSTFSLTGGSAVWSSNNIVVTLPGNAKVISVSILNSSGTAQLTAGISTLTNPTTVTINMSGFVPITGTWELYINLV